MGTSVSHTRWRGKLAGQQASVAGLPRQEVGVGAKALRCVLGRLVVVAWLIEGMAVEMQNMAESVASKFWLRSALPRLELRVETGMASALQQQLGDVAQVDWILRLLVERHQPPIDCLRRQQGLGVDPDLLQGGEELQASVAPVLGLTSADDRRWNIVWVW